MIKNKIYIHNFFYIKLEFYLNLFVIINNNKLIVNNFNLNLFFLKKKLIDKFILKIENNKKKIICLNYFNYNDLFEFIKINKPVLLKNIYLKKYINNNILISKLDCFNLIFNNFKNIFFIIFKFLNFINKNE